MMSGIIVPVGALDEALAQPALCAAAGAPPAHAPVVAFVIVAEQVQQTVQREHPQFGQLGVARGARLPAGDAARDDDVAQIDVGRRQTGAVSGRERAGPAGLGASTSLASLRGRSWRDRAELNTSVAIVTRLPAIRRRLSVADYRRDR